MAQEKVAKAYQRFYIEERNVELSGTNNIDARPAIEEAMELWERIATIFTGLIGAAQLKQAVEKVMTEYYPPIKKQHGT